MAAGRAALSGPQHKPTGNTGGIKQAVARKQLNINPLQPTPTRHPKEPPPIPPVPKRNLILTAETQRSYGASQQHAVYMCLSITNSTTILN